MVRQRKCRLIQTLSVIFFCALCCCNAFCSGVTNVSARVNFPYDGRVQIRYDILSDYDDCTDKNTRIFVSDPKNGVTTEAMTFESALSYTSGRKLVIWNALRDGYVVDDTNFVCRVYIECSRPFPDYCAVDLSQNGTDAISYLATVPSDGWGSDYKTSKLLLRKIPAGSYTMQNLKQVVLTRPFYIGVYEVTQGQWEKIVGTRPSYNAPSTGYEMLPVDSITRYSVCGYSENSPSFLKTLRTKYSIYFGLPTEAQWEYACRAGTSTDYNNGKNCTSKSGRDAGLDEVATYYDGETEGPSVVGLKAPNDFGLYDMHGNVSEMCADWYGELLYGSDPTGPNKGSCHVTRGGSWMWTAEYCTSYYRDYRSGDSVADADRGFRVAVTLSDDILTVGGESRSLVEVNVAEVNYCVECDVLEFSATNRVVGTVLGRMPYYANEGKVYEGWVEILGGLATPVSSSWKVCDDCKLYPAWHESSKKLICFDADEKFYAFKDEGDVLGALPVPEKDDYEFVGWFTERIGGAQVLSNTQVSDTVTYYAHWRCQENVECRESVDGVSYYFSVTNGEAYIGRLGRYNWYFCAVSCDGRRPIHIPSELGGFPVVGINALAFRDLAIPAVSLPDTLRTISNSAFQMCTNVFEMTIPASVTNIGATAFYGCWHLTNLNVDVGNPFYVSEDGYLLRRGELILRVPGARGDVYRIPSSCKKIGQRALESKTMREVEIPDSVEVVAEYAFSSCLYLTNVVFPSRLTELGEGSFSQCERLPEVTLPTGLVEIPTKAFYGCSNLQSVKIPSTVQVIGQHAFCNCVLLKSIKLPQSVLRLEAGAFLSSGLEKIIVPSAIEEICAYAIPANAEIVYCYPLEVPVFGQSVSSHYTGGGVCTQWQFWSAEVADREGGVQYWFSSYGRIDPSVFMVYTNVGCYTSTISESSLTNLNESFDVSWKIVSDAQVEILPRTVKVVGGSAVKHYDGIPLTSSDVTIGGQGFVAGECDVSVVGSQTDVGVSSNVVHLTWRGNGKPSNYDLDITDGTLTVLPALVAAKGTEPGEGDVPTGGISRFDTVIGEYDGVGHTIDVAKLNAVTLVGDTPDFSYSLTSNGVYRSEPYYFTNVCVTTVWYRVSAANYEDFVHEARVTILPRTVTICSGSASRKYDGTALTCQSASIVDGGFVGTECVKIEYVGTQTELGESANLFEIVCKDGTLASNYRFVKEYGTLTVTLADALPAPSLNAASFAAPGNRLQFSDIADGVIIYYTLDGSAPTTNSLVYAGSISATDKTRLRAVAKKYGYEDSMQIDVMISTVPGVAVMSSEGPANWSRYADATVVTNSGVECHQEDVWRSGEIADSEKSVLKAQVYGKGKISFWWKVSCEKWRTMKLDYLEFAVDGVPREPWINGETEWAYLEFDVDSDGEHTLTWTYAKDDEGTEGEDCGRVCAIVWTPRMETLADYLNNQSLAFVTSGDAEWSGDLATNHDGVTSLRSGQISDGEKSVVETTVDGPGKISFWWKVSSEAFRSYQIDYVSFSVDGVERVWIGGDVDWTNLCVEVLGGGTHVLSWVYQKDEERNTCDGSDCAWLDEIAWEPASVHDPIPDLGENPTKEEITNVFVEAKAEDPKLAEKITTEAAYTNFSAWAKKVQPQGGGDAVGAAGVMAAPNAWLSYALGSETLLEAAPTDEDLTVEAFEPKSDEDGKFDFTVSVEGVEVGGAATTEAQKAQLKENLKQVFGLEGGTSLESGGMSSANVDITFGTPADGKVKFTAGPNAKNADAKTFFMKVKINP